MTLLKDESGANAVEYALIMALCAVFIIGAVILMATEIGSLLNSMAACLSDAVNCSAETFSHHAAPPPDDHIHKGGGD